MLFGLSEPAGLQPLRNLFIAFGIAERVVYSTMNKLSGDSLRAKGDIHQLVRDCHRQQSREQQVKQVRKSCCGRGRRSFRRDFHGKSEVHTKRVVGMMRAFGRDGRSGPIMVFVLGEMSCHCL